MTDEAIVTAEDLARTYDGGYYDDVWPIVQQYWDVMDYRSRHPNKGSSAIASALELPRSRIRTWLDGGQPDAAHAIDVARRMNWIETDATSPTFEGLNAMVSNVFSGGSIAEQYYRPSFALDPNRRQLHIVDAIEAVGVDYEIVDDRDGRADEVRPTEHGTILGRVLACLGAPVGSKTQQRIELPGYLEDAPDAIRETFVLCYLENRATKPHNGIVRFREERTDAYLRDLARLIEDVAGASVSVSEKNVILSRDATDAIGQ
ncbi:hypothetical protein Halru_2038 [Halovivax ruber XH-70]|uniref:Uncharacterized protein n=1 Tax=Halovivax ruber (strain DSM 18193 / JCM 13892 / XH-70) TaxID=797302 RepID=L0IF77_HALRX|nr:hypothetical protein [Halovivax ruber]AGB16632.1 hypothetical protein Halru_2038 [Halovivax ruber XH-70]